MTTKAAKASNPVPGDVDIDKMAADMEQTAASMEFPGTSRLLGDRRKIEARTKELLAEREHFLSRQQLADSQHEALTKAISTNIADIDATLALYPTREPAANNIVPLNAAQ